MATLNFDTRTVEPGQSYDPIPKGWYIAHVEESNIVQTKSGTGSYLKTKFVVLDGEYKGRAVFQNFNIMNSNKQAEEIARRQLADLGRAVNVIQIQDSQQLHGIPLKIKVAVRKGEGEFNDQNVIKDYKPMSYVTPNAAPAPAFGAPQVVGLPPTQGAWAPPATVSAPQTTFTGQPWAPPPVPAAAAPAPVAPEPVPVPQQAPAPLQHGTAAAPAWAPTQPTAVPPWVAK